MSGSLTVTTTGALTDSGTLVVAGPTTLAAGAANNITLNNANDFSTVSIVSGNTVVLNDVTALDLGASTVSGSLTVTTTGALTDSGNLVVAGPTTLAAGAANNITLDNANDFSTVAITSGNNVVLNDVTALDLGASTVSGSLTVTTTGALTDSGNLVVAGPTTLAAGAANNITLDNANDFSTVAITSGNSVTLTDVNALDLGTSTVSGALSVTTTGAITDSGNLVVAGPTTLTAGAANNITLNNANDFSTVSVVSGNTVVLNDVNALDLGASTIGTTLTVTTGGALTQSGALVAPNLAVTSGGPVTLTNAGNDVDNLAAQVTGAANGLQFTDIDGFAIGTVGVLNGIITNDGDIALVTGGALTLTQTVNAGTADVGLQANGAATQGAGGQITANELNLRGSGPFTLTNAANDVNTVGANTTGAIQVNDVDDLTVGAVAAVGTIPASGGLTSGNNDIALVTGGALTLTQTVNAGTADVGLQANGAATQGAGGQITANELNLRGSGPFTLTNAANDVNTVGANTTGAIQVNDVDDLTVGAVAAVGTIPASGGLTSGNNDIALVTGGALTLTQAVNAGTADVGLQANGAATQGAGGQITANELNLRGSGPFTLTNAANDVNTVGANTTGAIQVNDVDDLTVGAVAAVGTIPASGGLTSGNNDIALVTGGALTLTQTVNAGTANIGIASGGSTTQGGAGQLMGDNLNLQGNGPYVLTNPNNDINTAGGTVLASLVTIADIDGFVVGNVPAVGTLPAAGPFPLTPPVPPSGGGTPGDLAPSVRPLVFNTFGQLNQETFVPMYYPFGHPILGWTIRSVTSIYLPTTTLNLPLFDNRGSRAGSEDATGQGGCAEQPGDKEVSGQSAPRGGCEEGAIK